MLLTAFDLFARVTITLVMILATCLLPIWQWAELRQSDRTYPLAAGEA